MQTTLYYREGSSDKVYQVEVVPTGGRFLVNFAFGRRGATLSAGSKTPAPVDEAQAKDLFAKLVREKKAKGYSEGTEGTPYQHSAQAGRVTEYRPQLLNPISDEDLDTFLGDPNWCLQEKKDGRRLLIQKTGSDIQGINRRGLVVSLPSTLQEQIQRIPHDFVIDGEIIGETFHAFDLLAHHDQTVMPKSYQERLNALELLIWDGHVDRVLTVPTFYGETKKRDAYADFRKANAEGVVFKLLSASYQPGRPNSGGPALKFKFYAETACIAQTSHRQRRSVALGLYDGEELVSVGHVTVPPNRKIPQPGEIVQVRYLYALLPSRALFQPVYQWTRDDLEPMDCTVEDLKFKREDSDEEAL